MSFEGYYQLVCENGHYTTDHDIYGEIEQTFSCSICASRDIAWMNVVDCTNVDNEGYFDLTPFISVNEVREKCNLGNDHVTQFTTYNIAELKKAYDIVRQKADEEWNIPNA